MCSGFSVFDFVGLGTTNHYFLSPTSPLQTSRKGQRFCCMVNLISLNISKRRLSLYQYTGRTDMFKCSGNMSECGIKVHFCSFQQKQAMFQTSLHAFLWVRKLSFRPVILKTLFPCRQWSQECCNSSNEPVHAGHMYLLSTETCFQLRLPLLLFWLWVRPTEIHWKIL